MKNTIKATVLFFCLSIVFSSCELFELTQEEAFRVTASGSNSYVDFSARNISDRDINNVRWTATVYDEDDDTIDSFSGREGFVERGNRFSRSLNISNCFCDYAHCARITVKWENAKGRTCYEWCTIYL